MLRSQKDSPKDLQPQPNTKIPTQAFLPTSPIFYSLNVSLLVSLRLGFWCYFLTSFSGIPLPERSEMPEHDSSSFLAGAVCASTGLQRRLGAQELDRQASCLLKGLVARKEERGVRAPVRLERAARGFKSKKWVCILRWFLLAQSRRVTRASLPLFSPTITPQCWLLSSWLARASHKSVAHVLYKYCNFIQTPVFIYKYVLFIYNALQSYRKLCYSSSPTI